MELAGKVVIVTGGGGGIGSALGRRFAAEGARTVVLADIDADAARAAADAIGPAAKPVRLDAADFAAVAGLVDAVEGEHGPVDLFCANAGIGLGTGLEAPEAEWDRVWRVNLKSIVAAARTMVPRWTGRGGGYLLVTASAAGLLTSLGDAAYSATKHAAVGLAEWVAITYGDQGVRVSCLCPQGVRTNMVFGPGAAGHLAAEQVKRLGVIEPDEVAEAVGLAINEERFLVLPHPETQQYFRNKADSHDRWLRGMRKFQRALLEEA